MLILLARLHLQIRKDWSLLQHADTWVCCSCVHVTWGPTSTEDRPPGWGSSVDYKEKCKRKYNLVGDLTNNLTINMLATYDSSKSPPQLLLQLNSNANSTVSCMKLWSHLQYHCATNIFDALLQMTPQLLCKEKCMFHKVKVPTLESTMNTQNVLNQCECNFMTNCLGTQLESTMNTQ